jgi:hypothetical protein
VPTADVESLLIDMVYTIAGILLALALGMCVLAFPFVLWMISRDRRATRPASNGHHKPASTLQAERSRAKLGKKPRQSDGLRVRQPLYVDRVAYIILALNVRRLECTRRAL